MALIPIPTFVGDVAPAKDGALAEFFCELQTFLVRRTTRHGAGCIEKSLALCAERLLQIKQHKTAAVAWLRYALSQPDQKALKLNLNEDCIIFVKFYWLLYKSKPDWNHVPAMKYLNSERKKRSDYILDIDVAGDGSHLVSNAIHSPAITDTLRQSKVLVPREEKRGYTDEETGTPGRGSPTAGVGGLDQPEPVPERATKRQRIRADSVKSNTDMASDALSLKPTILVYPDLDDKPAGVLRLQHEGPRKRMPSNHKKAQKASSSGPRKNAAQPASPKEAKAFNGGPGLSTDGFAPDRHPESARTNGDASTFEVLDVISSRKSNHYDEREGVDFPMNIPNEATLQQQQYSHSDEPHVAPGGLRSTGIKSLEAPALLLAAQTAATRTPGSSKPEPASPKIVSRKRSHSHLDGRSFKMEAQTSSHPISEVSTSSAPLKTAVSASLRPSAKTIPPGPSVGTGKRSHNYEGDQSQTTASYIAFQDVSPPRKKPKGSPTIDSSQLIKFEDRVDQSRTFENWISDDPHVIDHEEEEELSYEAMFTDAVMRLSADSEPAIGCRQPLPKYPPIWARSRQEVCETWDWFRSYQGGVYFSQNEAKGYLLSAFSSKRDGWFHDGKLIISHGGGKAESISHSKGHRHEKQAASDQNAEDFSVRALLKNFRNNTPVALLIDDKYVHFPFSLGARDITYAVLGFYKITHFWSELQPANNDRGRVVRYKFAFQWYESQGQPWWWLTSEDLPITNTDAPTAINSVLNPPPSAQHGSRKSPVKKAVFEEKLYLPNHSFGSVYRKCSNCQLMSPQVYDIGWMCLQSECQRFWVIDASDTVLPEQLKYNLAFLELLPNLTLPVTLNIFPPPPPLVLEGTITTTELFSKGWHCTKCGRLSCRYKWQVWECAHCKNSLLVQGAIQHARDLQSISLSIKMRNGSGDNLIFPDSGVKRRKQEIFRDGDRCGTLETFVFPDDAGFVHRIKGCGVGMYQEANQIFIKYQEQAMEGKLIFRRWPLRAHQCRGDLLAHYFSQNSGEPYHYVGGTENTVPWDQAPSAVVGARALMQHRIKLALGDTCESEFNEVLSAAYMQKQKMAFHSDSERGLGPTVAGLSLGSPALMHFRKLKPRRRKDEPIPENEEKTDKVLSTQGDILVMQGANIQRCYEHTVVPSNFRIAATARYIAPDTLV
ncbi:hypothetical protein ARMGADRAFT_1172179 [Armillaria gallica]|uniref:Alpha-ketoglutarate-dependent dioxygenase AlkB-like domain-containing protein n=1 Tax=Armillaria gallica TaxID=47427 RepID=A0A2H3CA12_ARMGA|nr:hypothetical protein ARMGADRAFT_1172179 [Armillaria gallica]